MAPTKTPAKKGSKKKEGRKMTETEIKQIQTLVKEIGLYGKKGFIFVVALGKEISGKGRQSEGILFTHDINSLDMIGNLAIEAKVSPADIIKLAIRLQLRDIK